MKIHLVTPGYVSNIPRVLSWCLTSSQIQDLQGMGVPPELQREIFQQSLVIAKQDSKALDHIKIVAESYAVGFGTPKDLESAFRW